MYNGNSTVHKTSINYQPIHDWNSFLRIVRLLIDLCINLLFFDTFSYIFFIQIILTSMTKILIGTKNITCLIISLLINAMTMRSCREIWPAAIFPTCQTRFSTILFSVNKNFLIVFIIVSVILKWLLLHRYTLFCLVSTDETFMSKRKPSIFLEILLL